MNDNQTQSNQNKKGRNTKSTNWTDIESKLNEDGSNLSHLVDDHFKNNKKLND